MNDMPKPLEDLGFDPEAVRRKYQEEADKRWAAGRPMQRVASSKTVSIEDPFAEPIERAPLFDEVDVVVVGAGFAGMVAGAYLRKCGIANVRIIDKAGGFGGAWYWNRYPGIRCDVDASIYLPLLEDVGSMPSEKFAHGDEIRAHCKALVEKYDLDKMACLQTQVTGLRWDTATSRWRVTTDRGDEIRAQFVCVGNGNVDLPIIPATPGMETFKGQVFHSSRWDYEYTGGTAQGGLSKLADKGVAVVGTAASAIQFIPYLADDAKRVIVFQRTPVIIQPRENQPTGPEWYRRQKPGWYQERLQNFTAALQTPPGRKPPEVDLIDDTGTRMVRLARQGTPELAAKLEGLDFQTKALILNYAAMEQIRANMAAQVADPVVAEAIKPYYNLGCKRPQFSDAYLPTYNRPNVTLVDTQGQGITRLTPKGVVAGDVEYEVDCIIFATGFEVDGGKTRWDAIPATGRNGQKLADASGSLHGMMVAGFPNLFVVGAVARSAFTFNFTHLLTEQSAHVATIVGRCRAEGAASVEVRPEAQEAWTAQVARLAEGAPKLDLACPPDDIGPILRAGYPRGPLEYFEVCRAWLEDGYHRDLIFER